MATWDFGGGCPCGISKECDCKEKPLASDLDGDYCSCCGASAGFLHHSECIHAKKTNLGTYTPGPRQAKAVIPQETKIKSDGGSTGYYAIPAGATDLIDLIEHKKMSFSLGNIFKACYRLGEKEGNDLLYDLNKIIFFAERMKKEVEKTR